MSIWYLVLTFIKIPGWTRKFWPSSWLYSRSSWLYQEVTDFYQEVSLETNQRYIFSWNWVAHHVHYPRIKKGVNYSKPSWCCMAPYNAQGLGKLSNQKGNKTWELVQLVYSCICCEWCKYLLSDWVKLKEKSTGRLRMAWDAASNEQVLNIILIMWVMINQHYWDNQEHWWVAKYERYSLGK